MTKIESEYKEMMDDVQMSGSMIAYCMKAKALELELELTAAQDEIERLKDHCRIKAKALINQTSERMKAEQQRDVMEKKLRIELRGHPDSELWGDAGLIAATMRCVDALDEVTEQRDQWKAKYIQQNKDLGHELRDSNETIWSECALANVRLTHKQPTRTNYEHTDTEN